MSARRVPPAVPPDGDHVYVGGKYGDTPLVVARSLETAMHGVLEVFISEHPAPGRDDRWLCECLDGQADQLRCTVTVIDDDGETHHLYVERYDLE